LDVGCGGGEFLLFLQSLGYTNTFGIDLSPEQIELAKKQGLRDVEVAEAIEYLSKHKEKFALITAHDVIEHFPKEKMLPFLDAIYAALVGGTVILSTVNAESPFGARHRYYDFTHEVAFIPPRVSLKCFGRRDLRWWASFPRSRWCMG
jgi:2-polyprenyl-3-methyl-5-hydroxy-6-metoxy-1,4-benzoquinol methylase